MSGKGDKRRPGDNDAYRDNYDRIFKKEPQCPTPLSGDTDQREKQKARKRGRPRSTESS